MKNTSFNVALDPCPRNWDHWDFLAIGLIGIIHFPPRRELVFLWANESYHLEQYTEVLWGSKASSGNLMGEPYKSVSNSLQLHLQYETAV